MSFKAILEELTIKSRATGAAMLDYEGEMVDCYSIEENHDLDVIGAHKGIIFNLMKHVTKQHNPLDGLKSVGIKTANGKILIQALKEDYYVVITLNGTGTLGHASYEANLAADKLETEMG